MNRVLSRMIGYASALVLGENPRKIVNYGEPFILGGYPTEREAPLWMLYSPFHRRLLP